MESSWRLVPPKEGSHYDLPIVLGMMVAMGALPADAISGRVVLGELALDGRVAKVAGVLPAAMAANAMDKGLICPAACGPEAAWASSEMDILAPDSLIQLVNHVRGNQVLSPPRPALKTDTSNLPDLADIKGQESAKRALEMAERTALEAIVTEAVVGNPDQRQLHRSDLALPRDAVVVGVHSRRDLAIESIAAECVRTADLVPTLPVLEQSGQSKGCVRAP